MSDSHNSDAVIAIACGGTGGHLFPGLALGSEFLQRGCGVTLLISEKEVDQQAVKGARGMEILSLPSVGLTRGARLAFLRGFLRSYRAVDARFRQHTPAAVIGMGGFTSAPAVLCGRRRGAKTFIHESNTIPGRANRLLARVADGVFVGFPSAANRLSSSHVVVSGTPVRRGFGKGEAGACRALLGLDPGRPVLLVMGGSQGASGVNQLVLEALPIISSTAPELQWLHLAGTADCSRMREAYRAQGVRARVEPFLDTMEHALGAATVAVSRAGASSIAEMAAVHVPVVLIPYPVATDNHQFYNALALCKAGAARLLEQRATSAEELAGVLLEMLGNADELEKMRRALAAWHRPDAARVIAETVLLSLSAQHEAKVPTAPRSLDRRTSLA